MEHIGVGDTVVCTKNDISDVIGVVIRITSLGYKIRVERGNKLYSMDDTVIVSIREIKLMARADKNIVSTAALRILSLQAER